MDFSFTEEQELFRQAVREWCEKNLSLEKVREMDEKEEMSMDVIKGMADLGLLLMTVPEEHGGTGSDWVTACIAAEELAYADISIAVPVFFLVEASWGYVIDRYCSEEVREKYIKKAIRGEAFVGIATTEPGGGSDIASVKTTAKKEGDEWVINGEKIYISGTEEAKKMGGGYFIIARTDPKLGHRGMTAFFLPIDAPGVEITKRYEDMGRMGISTGGFVMNDVRLSDEYVLGEVNKGFYYTMEGFDLARLLIGATSVGATQRALEIGMDYTKQRILFGRPLAKFEGIQFEMADLWARNEALRSLVYRAAWMVNEKYSTGRFGPLEVSKLISAVKLLGPPLAFRTFEKAMIWLGAYGYTKECPLEMGLRGIMSYCVGAEGGLNIQRIIIARELLGREYVPYK
ncbi:MAG: acyl-CoA dehydrogenase family protein [Candidatus Baldrarchaeia archaeon]